MTKRQKVKHTMLAFDKADQEHAQVVVMVDRVLGFNNVQGVKDTIKHCLLNNKGDSKKAAY